MLRPLVESTVSLLSGIIRRWVGFLPAALLAVLDLVGVDVPSPLVGVVFAFGAFWAVLLTYHEMHSSLGSAFGQLIVDHADLSVGISAAHPETAIVAPRIWFANHGDRPMRLRIERMEAVVNGRSTPQGPLLVSELTVPVGGQRFIDHQPIPDVPEIKHLASKFDYWVTYGYVGSEQVARLVGRMLIEASQLVADPNAYQCIFRPLTETETRIVRPGWWHRFGRPAAPRTGPS